MLFSIAEHTITQPTFIHGLPRAPRRYILDTALNLSWPAISQSCSLTALPSRVVLSLVEKSQPIVGLTFSSNFLWIYWQSMDVFPTAGYPTMQNLIIMSWSITWQFLLQTLYNHITNMSWINILPLDQNPIILLINLIICKAISFVAKLLKSEIYHLDISL